MRTPASRVSFGNCTAGEAATPRTCRSRPHTHEPPPPRSSSGAARARRHELRRNFPGAAQEPCDDRAMNAGDDCARDPFDVLSVCPICGGQAKGQTIAFEVVQGTQVWCKPCGWVFLEEINTDSQAAGFQPMGVGDGLSDELLGHFTRILPKLMRAIEPLRVGPEPPALAVARDLAFARSVRHALRLTKEALSAPDDDGEAGGGA